MLIMLIDFIYNIINNINLKYLLILNLIFIAYLIGSISNAILLSNWLKLPDPRTIGSNNPGTTNILRTAGKKLAIIVLILDVTKGFIPVYFMKFFNIPECFIAGIAIAVFIGHLFPIFFKFKGGKGVATTLGILLAIYWPLALIILAIWIVTFILCRISSLAALSATMLAIIICSLNLYLIHKPFNISKDLNHCIIILSILIIITHRENIKKLLNNTENLI